jgi:putative acetyltransferase
LIRKYETRDLEELLETWSRASAIAHPFLSREFLELERHNIPNVYLPNAETWVWDANGSVIGFIALLGNEVGAIFVDPEHHKAGIGRCLMDHARKLRGHLEVEVFKRNDIGRKFYAQYGFELMHEAIHDQTGLEVLRLQLPVESREE